MGGYGAMNLGLRHPELYGQVVSIAGFFHAEDNGVFGGDPTLQASNSPDQHLDVAPFPRVLLCAGEQDTNPDVGGETQRFDGLLTDAQIPHETVIEPGNHDWDYVASQFPLILDFLGRGFPPPS